MRRAIARLKTIERQRAARRRSREAPHDGRPGHLRRPQDPRGHRRQRQDGEDGRRGRALEHPPPALQEDDPPREEVHGARRERDAPRWATSSASSSPRPSPSTSAGASSKCCSAPSCRSWPRRRSTSSCSVEVKRENRRRGAPAVEVAAAPQSRPPMEAGRARPPPKRRKSEAERRSDAEPEALASRSSIEDRRGRARRARSARR